MYVSGGAYLHHNSSLGENMNITQMDKYSNNYYVYNIIIPNLIYYIVEQVADPLTGN